YTHTDIHNTSMELAEVTQDLGLVKDAIVVEAGWSRSPDPGVGSGRSLNLEAERGRNQDPEAGKEKGRSGLIPAQDRDTGIGLEAGVGQTVGVEIEKRELKNREDLAEVKAGLRVHFPSEAETQQ
uniref:Uncharacterized protein n=1 Tax=Theropithecus gelada TaxID=9565 RepID=A0A8D2JWY2_THEGE